MAMDSSMISPQPILQHGRFRGSRKYGRYDFERFDHLSSTHASIGHNTFDKVNIDCRFLFKKSKWGVIGEYRNPAGIIYLDLTFDQPKGCQLDSATISITLDDEDRALRDFSETSYRSRTPTPIQMTDCYGPKGFAGPEKFVHTKKSLHLTPKADILGYGFGGIGTDKESNFMTSSRWKFSGTLLPGKGRKWAYKTLKWDLSENDLEAQSTHSSKIHTAFTFEHSGQPFFMKVEIKGKLKKLHGRLKDRLMKFPSVPNNEADSVATLIKFGDRMSFTTPLDERAQNLPFEMEIANLNAIPMEVSGPKPANFLNVPQGVDASNMENTSAASKPWSQTQGSIGGSQLHQLLPAAIPSHLLQGTNYSEVTVEDTDPIMSELARAFVDLQTAKRPSVLQDKPVKPCSNPIENEESPQSETVTRHNEMSSRQKPKEMSEEQVLLGLFRMPVFVIFIRMIAGFLGLLGQTPQAINVDQEEEKLGGTST